MPWRGLNTSSRESAWKPASRLRTLYGRVELIVASDGAVMPTAELGLFGSLGLNGEVVALGSGFTTGAVGKMEPLRRAADAATFWTLKPPLTVMMSVSRRPSCAETPVARDLYVDTTPLMSWLFVRSVGT